MKHRVGLAGTMERNGVETLKAMIGKLKSRMLAGDQQDGFLAECGEGMGNRAQLDGFRSRADNKRNTILAQPSP